MPAPELTSVSPTASERALTVSVRLQDALCDEGAIEAKESEKRSWGRFVRKVLERMQSRKPGVHKDSL
jgi:hypothetical protein